MSAAILPFSALARLPAAGDNVAIAIRRIEAGERVALEGAGPVTLPHTVLEGHRFAVRPIVPGQPLLSWGMPFGTATRAIAAGDYVSNPAMLQALAVRRVERLVLPAEANFEDWKQVYVLDEATFQPGPAPEPPVAARTFSGYRRPGGRGVGTRNMIVILGTSSRTAGLARQLAARLQPWAKLHPSIDGIVAVAHTEGGGRGEPNNRLEVQRALAGFLVHPNVGAVLALDHGNEPVSNARLEAFARAQGYPLDHVRHRFLSADAGLAAALAEGERIVRGWLPAVAADARTPEPLSALRVALQCGGSDAFSGVSGNPLAGAMVHEVVRQGGIGVMTETDEAVGAESYLLRNVRDLTTARRFLGLIDGFRERLAWFGVSPENNPSAGNRFRGLYNIALKSLGAVHKKDPRTRLDHVIDYAQPLREPGFTFMNGPGNDLEGIAGQAGAGCNVFLFVTGNGSITNFPFIPTLKITTTTRRHQLLHREMDVNAGRYLDGEAWDQLVAEAVDRLVATASGELTQGERAGHSQVSLWRDWRQTGLDGAAALAALTVPEGCPLPLTCAEGPADLTPLPVALAAGAGTERVGLVLPTSLCAGQIARLAAERLTAAGTGRVAGIDRFVALPHSEGCGFAGEPMYHLLHRTYRGYLVHPNVTAALLLEHGCEKVPNDVMRRQLEQADLPLERFGWASVQLDGGIAKVIDKVEAWFAGRPAAPAAASAGLTLGLQSASSPGPDAAAALGRIARRVILAGGTVVLPESDPLLASAPFLRFTLGGVPPRATLPHGEPARGPGFHVVDTETSHWTENLTALGAAGAHLIVGLVADRAESGHPLVPVLQVVEPGCAGPALASDLDLVLPPGLAEAEEALAGLITATASGRHAAVALARGWVDFQLTRGRFGVST